jgi:hypothetical protein
MNPLETVFEFNGSAAEAQVPRAPTAFEGVVFGPRYSQRAILEVPVFVQSLGKPFAKSQLYMTSPSTWPHDFAERLSTIRSANVLKESIDFILVKR